VVRGIALRHLSSSQGKLHLAEGVTRLVNQVLQLRVLKPTDAQQRQNVDIGARRNLYRTEKRGAGSRPNAHGKESYPIGPGKKGNVIRTRLVKSYDQCCAFRNKGR
jgi:hypothetical protein